MPQHNSVNCKTLRVDGGGGGGGGSFLLICQCTFNNSPWTVTLTVVTPSETDYNNINALFCFLAHLFLFLFHLSDWFIYVQLLLISYYKFTLWECRPIHVCVAVTCHLHFWHNNQSFSFAVLVLHAAAVTLGWKFGTETDIRVREWLWTRKFSYLPHASLALGSFGFTCYCSNTRVEVWNWYLVWK